MALNKFKSFDVDIDDSRHLLCATPGCGRRWSVNFGKPLCSLHQWGSNPIRSEARDLTQAEKDNIHDKKFWAKRIMAEHDIGIKRPIAVVEMAKRALKLDVQP